MGLQRHARLQGTYPPDQFEPGPDCPLGVILMGARIAKIYEDAVAQILRQEAIEAAHDLGYASMIGSNDLAQVLRVHAGGKRRRADKVREHHRDLAPLSPLLGGSVGFR